MEIIGELYLLNSLAMLTGFFLDIFLVNRREVPILELFFLKLNISIARSTNKFSINVQLIFATIIIFTIVSLLLVISGWMMYSLLMYNRLLLLIMMSLFYLNIMRLGTFETKIRSVIKMMSQSKFDDALRTLDVKENKLQDQMNYDYIKRACIEKIAYFSCEQIVAIFFYGFIGGIPLILVYKYFDVMSENNLFVKPNNVYVRLVDTIHEWKLRIPFFITIAISLVACYVLKLSTRYAFEVYKLNCCMNSFTYKEQLTLFYLASFDMPFEPVKVENIDSSVYYEDIREIIKALQLMKLVAFLIFIVVSFYFVIVVV